MCVRMSRRRAEVCGADAKETHVPGLTTAFTISLDDPDARDPSRVGEKAAALARMRQHGLPVPFHRDAAKIRNEWGH